MKFRDKHPHYLKLISLLVIQTNHPTNSTLRSQGAGANRRSTGIESDIQRPEKQKCHMGMCHGSRWDVQGFDGIQ